MASKVKVDQIEGSTGSSITIPSGQTLTIADGLASSTITSGTLADARIPNLNASKINAGTIPVARGGTGLTSLGTANQVIAVNSGASALEFQNAASGSVPVVETFNNTAAFFSTQASTHQDVTALDTAITPSATSSKILIMVHLDCSNDTFHYQQQFRIQRKIGSGSFGSNVTNGYGSGDSQSSSRATRSEYDTNGGCTMYGTFIDAPNTTDAVTYRIQVKNSSGGGTLYLNRNSSNSSNSGNWQRAYACKVIAMELKQ